MRHRFLVCAVAFAALVSWAGGDTYFTDFTQDDGPPEGWVIINPTVAVESGELTLSPTAGVEVVGLVGHGGVGLWFEDITRIEFDLSFPGSPGAWPFDHGGVFFCAQRASGRYGVQTAYVIDYLAAAPDNPAAGRFRLGRFINGAEAGITEAPAVGNVYEGRWAIELTETTITLFFNDVEQFHVVNTEIPRNGYVGFWAFQAPPENKMAVDNLSIEHTPGPCPLFLSGAVMTAGKANALVPVTIPVGANAAEAYEVSVVSMDPGTVTVVNSSLVFEAGGSILQYVELAPGSAGQTLIYAEAAGQDCSAGAVMAEVLKPVAFEETFTQPDGPPEGWYIAAPTAQVINEELSLSAPGQPFVWYALEGQPLNVPKIEAVNCRIKFARTTETGVGAHGGIYLAPQPSDARSTGYMIDVIERASDNGFRIYKDNNAGVQLGGPRQPYVWDDQWHDWRLEFTPTGFRFTVDDGDTVDVTVDDLAYRGGYLAFWCYTGGGAAGQNMFVDDVRIEFGSSACPRIAPASAVNRPVNPKSVFTVTRPFDPSYVGDYEITVVSSDPSVAVPVGAVDGALVLLWPAGDTSLTKTFEAECLSPGAAQFVLDTGATSCVANTAATFTVREPGAAGFCDDFAQEDGEPENWTPYLGDWQVEEEKLVVECLPGENWRNETWIWAMNPAMRLEPTVDGAASLSFDVTFTQTTPDAVGRHGGFAFFTNDPTQRWATSGYEIDWIDREGDRGYRFLRSDNGVHTAVAGPTFAEFALGTEWRLDVDGAVMRFYVDGVMIFEVEDDTYREGYVGFWTYCNTTRAEFDNVVFGVCAPVGPLFRRGDVNADGGRDIADAIALLSHLFAGGTITCRSAGDANDDGALDIADAITILSYLFAGASDLPPPFAECGLDPTEDDLDCESFPPCE